MENNEKYIVGKLLDHREDIDLDDLWSGVSPNIPKEKKRRRIGFWIFGGLLIGLVVASITMMSDMPEEGIVQSPVNTSEVKNVTNNKSSVLGESVSTNNQKSIADANIKTVEKTISSNETQAIANNVNGISDNSSNIVDHKNNDLNENEKVFEIDLLTMKPETAINEIAANALLHENTVVDDRISNVIEKSHEVKERISEIQMDAKDRIMANANLLPGIKFKLLNAKRKTIVDRLEVNMPDLSSPRPKINMWSVYVMGGVAAVDRKLSTKSQEQIYEKERLESITDILGAWEIEGGIGYRLNPRLRLSTGLNYTQIHERAQFTSEEIVDFTVTSNDQINKQDGTIENLTGSYVGQGIKRIHEVRYNQLKLLQIPVRVQYELVNINKMKLNVGGLFSYGIWQEYKGFTSFSSSESSYDLTVDKDNKFRNSGSISYGLCLDGTTHLTDLIDFSIGIGLRRTSKINSEIYLIDQEYNSFTITSGISRRF